MACRLMGAALNARGFDCFWIDPKRLKQSRTTYPAVGESRRIGDANVWSALLHAHEASEAAFGARGHDEDL